jgi:hypothetical protein
MDFPETCRMQSRRRSDRFLTSAFDNERTEHPEPNAGSDSIVQKRYKWEPMRLQPRTCHTNYRHPLPEHVYDVYMQYWKEVAIKK